MSSNRKDKTEKLFDKAEQLFRALQYKKAGKSYFFAGEGFYEIKNFKYAQEAFFKAADSFIQKRDHDKVIKSLRKSVNSYFELEDIENARLLLEKIYEYVENLKNKELKDSYYLLYSSLIYLCYYILGEPNKGFHFVKRAQKKVDKGYFKENPLIHLVTNLTIALRDKKKKNIERITSDFNKLKLTSIEKKIVKMSILLADLHVSVSPEFKLDKERYTTKEIIQMNLEISNSSLVNIINNSFYDFKIEEFQINSFKINVTDNLAIQTKPELPIILDLKNNFNNIFRIKPQFLIEKCSIGPIKIECRINGKYSFFIENRGEMLINLFAPPTSLEVSLTNLKPPLIDKSFPIEILIENNSQGEASDLNIEIKFPEGIKVIRGTIEKQIYSLRSKEKIKWEINARPLEAGDYEIEIYLKFKDPDDNSMEEKKLFPIAIKL